MAGGLERKYIYKSETTILAGRIRLPFESEIKPQAYSRLQETGGYLSQRAHDHRVESLINIYSGYTQVAGHPAAHPCEGWVTLTTAVVEGLNILDVVTADRIVAQTITINPLIGYVPTVSFLGTRFENLAIAGHPVEVELDLDVLGPKPPDDAPYSSDRAFLSRAARQHEEVRRHSNLPPELAERYNRLSSTVETDSGKQETIECSLVNLAEGAYPGDSYGQVIKIPHFGILTLARLRLQQTDYDEQTNIPKQTAIHLTMIDLELNCSTSGHIRCCDLATTGHGKP